MSKVFIIAEAGVNHNGDINIAKKMIDLAAEAKADAIKFQTFKAENLVNRTAEKADYQRERASSTETQYEMLKKLEFGIQEFKELKEYCKKRKILFLSTPFDIECIDLLNSLNISILKVPSGEITNLPYLRKIGIHKKKVILSTGMSNLGEIERALDILINSGTNKNDITILHCNTEYPTPFEDVNLYAMNTIQNAFNVKVGYSDHTLGIEVSIAAVALGAEIIEKHFTLDRDMQGPDHKASLEPDELSEMVKCIRNIEKSLGNGIKKCSISEKKNKAIVRKSVVANENIKKGDIFTEKNLTTKRPETGISPMRWDEIIGKNSQKDYLKDDLI